MKKLVPIFMALLIATNANAEFSADMGRAKLLKELIVNRDICYILLEFSMEPE